MKTLFLIAILTMIQLCGCSALGYSIGTAIDSSRPDPNEIDKSRLEKISLGASIIVFRENNTTEQGEYLGHLGSSIRIKKQNSISEILLQDIQRIEVSRTKYAKWLGLAIGLAIDVALVKYEFHWTSYGPI